MPLKDAPNEVKVPVQTLLIFPELFSSSKKIEHKNVSLDWLFGANHMVIKLAANLLSTGLNYHQVVPYPTGSLGQVRQFSKANYLIRFIPKGVWFRFIEKALQAKEDGCHTTKRQGCRASRHQRRRIERHCHLRDRQDVVSLHGC
nr:hypothetical protein [Tanacetum cinerariifolium]